MRIIAGHARGRRLKVPVKGTRPTSDRVRESLFSSLDSRLRASGHSWAGQRVADLYAGSGALGLEAMSRGADSVVFVEKSANACAVVRDNCGVVGVDPRSCRGMSVEAWVDSAPSTDGGFTLVFLDPPYTVARSAVDGILRKLVGRLAPGALIVVERARGETLVFPEPLVCIDERTFGETTLWYGHYSSEVGLDPRNGTEVECA